jgi:hypothetical protein
VAPWGGTCSRCGKTIGADEPLSIHVSDGMVASRLCDSCTKDKDRLAALERSVAEARKPLEQLLAGFGLTPEQVPFIGRFLLGHASLDRWLVILLALRHLKEETASGVVARADSEARLDELLATYSERTFSRHLGLVRERGLLDEELISICEEVNRGRDEFLHWMPGRFSIPKYQGLDVTTPEGLDRVLAGMWIVIEKISVRRRGIDF